MKKVCFFCGRLMGVKGKYPQAGIFHSVCDECSDKMGVDERLPELLRAIVDLRRQNGGREQPQTVGVLSVA